MNKGFIHLLIEKNIGLLEVLSLSGLIFLKKLKNNVRFNRKIRYIRYKL